MVLAHDATSPWEQEQHLLPNRRNRHGIWLGGILYFINENGRHLHVPGNGGTRKSRSYHMIQLKIEPTLKARTRVGV